MATAEHGRDVSGPHPLLRGASPATVLTWLRDEDRARFVEEYEAALDDARRDLDLVGVHQVVERWRRIAVLQTDTVGFRETLRRVAEFDSGEPSPEDEPWDVTRAKVGL